VTWNAAHINEVRYKEPDLQAAYQHFKDMEVFYWVQVTRKYKVVDNSPVQDAWNSYLKLRNHYGHNRRPPNSPPVPFRRVGGAILP